MTLISITAKFACDDCGELFHVDIDPACACQNAFEAATNELEQHEDGAVRCPPCTAKADAAWIREHPSFISGCTQVDGGWSVTTYDDTVLFIPAGNPAGVPTFDMDATPFMTQTRPQAFDANDNPVAFAVFPGDYVRQVPV